MFRFSNSVLAALMMVGIVAGLLRHGGTQDSSPEPGPTHQSTNPWALDAPKPVAGAATVGSSTGPGEAIALARDGSGQFHIEAQVNGQDARFLVDTGADTVAISEDEAQRLGVDMSAADFAPIVQTAAGQGMATRVTIDNLTVGGTDLGRVSALVVRGLSTNLLGQSVLRRMGRVELSGDRMVIQPG